MWTIRAGLEGFAADESGAVTDDWLTLVALAVGVGLLAVHIVARSTADVSAEIEAALRDARVDVTFVDPASTPPSEASGNSGDADGR